MKIYKINLKSIFFKFLLVSIIMNFIISFNLDSKDFLFFVVLTVLIVGIEFLIFFSYRTLVRIEIKNDTIELCFRNFIMFKVIKIIRKTQFKYSYKNEIGARGIEAEELRFYDSDIKIVGIGRGFDGWKEEIIYQMIDEFRKLKIEEIE